MAKFIDLTGQQFKRLTVLSRSSNNEVGSAMWLCLCECGNYKIVVGTALRCGAILSCGCYKSEQKSEHMRNIGI